LCETVFFLVESPAATAADSFVAICNLTLLYIVYELLVAVVVPLAASKPVLITLICMTRRSQPAMDERTKEH
jgi:hypothetical protein